MFDKQINTVVKSCFFQPFLSQRNFETIIHPFISSCLDYCNSIYCGINHSSIER